MTPTLTKAGPARPLNNAVFALLTVGVVVIPLLFWPWAADVFVGPKFDAVRLLTASGALLAGTWLVVVRPTLSLRIPDVAAAAFLSFNVLAYALSVDRRTSLLGEPLQQAGLVSVFAFAGAYTLARISVRTPRRLGVLLAASSIAATIVAAYGFVQLLGGDPFWSSLPNGRVFSSIGQPNWLAAYLVLAIPLTASLTMVTTRRALRLAGIGATMVQIVVLVATLSRSGYLGLVASGIAGTLLAATRGQRTPRGRKQVAASAVAVVATTGALLFGLSQTTASIAPDALAQRASSAFDLSSFDLGRYVALWKVGLAIAVDHPLSGTGQDTYAIIFPDYRDRVLDEEYADHFSRFRPESPHNAYLAIAAGAGFPALAAYGFLVGSAIFILLPGARGKRQESILLAGIVTALVGHLATDWFLTIDLPSSWLFWVMIGAGLSAADTRKPRTALVGDTEPRAALPSIPQQLEH